MRQTGNFLEKNLASVCYPIASAYGKISIFEMKESGFQTIMNKDKNTYIIII